MACMLNESPDKSTNCPIFSRGVC